MHPGHVATFNSVADVFLGSLCHQDLPGDGTEQESNFDVLNCPQEVPLPLPSLRRAYRDSLANLAG